MNYFFRILFTFPIILIIFQAGCKRVYYKIIRLESSSPLIYEVKVDTNKINAFGGIDYAYIEGYYEGEKVDVIRLSYTSSITQKHTITNYHLSIYSGRYFVSGLSPRYGYNFTDIDFNGYKWAFGANASFKAGANFNFSEFRLGLGIEPNINLEFGDYYNFRKDASNTGVIENADGVFNFFVNIFPYLSYYFDDSKLMNFQLNLGYPGGISPVLSYQFGSNIFWVGYIPATIRLNIGYMMDFNSIKSQF